MGLLDELEQEAQRQRAEQARQAEQRDAREQHWQSQLLPALKALDDFLQRFTRHLAELQKRPRLSYSLAGYGDVVAAIEPNFTIDSTPAATSYTIQLDGVAVVVAEECPRIPCDSPARVRTVTALLQQHRLVGLADPTKDANGELRSATVFARGRIPLSLTVTADLDSATARMQFRNFEGLGDSSRMFRAEQLTEALFDQLGRFILREQPHFAQESVGDDVRRQLKTRLQRDQLKREWEQKLARQLDSDEAEVIASLHPSVRPGGWFGRLRMLSRRWIGR